MATEDFWRDSLIVLAIVILLAYAASRALNLLVGSTPSGDVPRQTILVVLVTLTVLGLGFVLWRSQADESSA